MQVVLDPLDLSYYTYLNSESVCCLLRFLVWHCAGYGAYVAIARDIIWNHYYAKVIADMLFFFFLSGRLQPHFIGISLFLLLLACIVILFVLSSTNWLVFLMSLQI